MYEGSHKNNISSAQWWRKGKKTNCGVSTLVLLVREAAPVWYVLEITVYLEQVKVGEEKHSKKTQK